MKQQIRILAGIAAGALMAGCGGGSDSSANSGAVNVAKYEGDWRGGCVAVSAQGSRKTILYLIKKNDTTLIFLANDFNFASPDCSGGATWITTSGTIVFNGSRTDEGHTVDKAIVNTQDAAASKQVFLIQGTGPFTLTLGRLGGDLDADGYPTTLELYSLTEQGFALEKYLGTWRGCAASGDKSEEHILALTRASSTSAYFTWTKLGHSSSNCSGIGFGTETEGGFLLGGTKNIGADTVDKVVISADSRPQQKQVFLVKGAGPVTLTPGRIDGGLDIDGYPTTLDSYSMTRQ